MADIGQRIVHRPRINRPQCPVMALEGSLTGNGNVKNRLQDGVQSPLFETKHVNHHFEVNHLPQLETILLVNGLGIGIGIVKKLGNFCIGQ